MLFINGRFTAAELSALADSFPDDGEAVLAAAAAEVDAGAGALACDRLLQLADGTDDDEEVARLAEKAADALLKKLRDH